MLVAVNDRSPASTARLAEGLAVAVLAARLPAAAQWSELLRLLQTLLPRPRALVLASSGPTSAQRKQLDALAAASESLRIAVIARSTITSGLALSLGWPQGGTTATFAPGQWARVFEYLDIDAAAGERALALARSLADAQGLRAEFEP